jgi:lipopolysaccharide export system permease protein
MRTMTRHVVIELTKVFLLGLTLVTGLVEIGILVRQLLREGLPLVQVVWLLPYLLPEAARYSIPVTLLLATTTVYSRMSGSHEVVALKALGISPMTILWPALVMAFLVSLVTVWLNDKAVSWGRRGAAQVVVDAMEEIAYAMLRTERCYASRHFTINVKGVEGRTLVRPFVTIGAQGSVPSITIDAETAELRVDHKENVLQIWAEHGSIEAEGRIRLFFGKPRQRQNRPTWPCGRSPRQRPGSATPSKSIASSWLLPRLSISWQANLSASEGLIGPAEVPKRKPFTLGSASSGWSRSGAGRRASVACASFGSGRPWRSGSATVTSSPASSFASRRS